MEHFEWLDPLFNERLETKNGRMLVPNRPGPRLHPERAGARLGVRNRGVRHSLTVSVSAPGSRSLGLCPCIPMSFACVLALPGVLEPGTPLSRLALPQRHDAPSPPFQGACSSSTAMPPAPGVRAQPLARAQVASSAPTIARNSGRYFACTTWKAPMTLPAGSPTASPPKSMTPVNLPSVARRLAPIRSR